MKKESLPRHDADAVPFMWAGIAIMTVWSLATVLGEEHMVHTSLLVATGLLFLGGIINIWKNGA